MYGYELTTHTEDIECQNCSSNLPLNFMAALYSNI